MVAVPRPRDKTYADYEALPEGVKAELIDGELFVLPPRKGHHDLSPLWLDDLP